MACIEIKGGEHLDIVVDFTVMFAAFFIFVKEDKNQQVIIMFDEGVGFDMRVHLFHIFKK